MAVDNQEESLLEDRAREVVVLLETAIGGLETSLASVGGALRVGGPTPETFAQAATPLVKAEAFDFLSLVDLRGDRPVIAAAAGPGREPGSELSGSPAETVREAGGQLNTTELFELGDEARTGLALGAPLVPEGFAVYAENVVTPFSNEPRQPDSPFEEIDVALYAGETTDRDQLVLATVELPLKGHVEEVTVQLGADPWVMQVAPRQALAGALTERLPWLVAGLGALLTLAVTLLVETLQRRRDYALALVDERTSELEASVRELERARAELEEADRLKDEFLDLAAHELRTPIAAIAGFAEVLTNGKPDQATHTRLLGRIWANARDMEELTNQLLDLSRLRAGRVDINPQPLLVRPATEECLDRVAAALEERPVTIDIPPDLAARADSQAFHRIVSNLLTNAAKFSEPDTPIAVTAEEQDGDVRVAVTDQGVGIAPEEQSLIFERFYRAGGGGAATRGSGVGLAIVGQYVALHGGQVGVESVPGEGSTFWFTLPLAREEATVS